MGCLARLGCLTLLAGVLLLAVAGWLSTRPVGPTFADGVYRYPVPGGLRSVALSTTAARRFDAKLAGQIRPADLLDSVTRGVLVTEEELNSRIAEDVTAANLTFGPARVERVFVRLAADGARAYIYTNGPLSDVTLQSRVAFRVVRGQVTMELRDIQPGRLPVGSAVAWALAIGGGDAQLEQRLTLAIPPHVRAIRVEEGQLRATLLPDFLRP